MGARYAFLSPSGTPEPCSQDTWLDWINNPQYDPCLAQERLDDYAVGLKFTGQWTGPVREPARFFTVTMTHPRDPGGQWSFETSAQAREGLRRVLEDCHRRAESEIGEAWAALAMTPK
jgi:hypothetical protein